MIVIVATRMHTLYCISCTAGVHHVTYIVPHLRITDLLCFAHALLLMHISTPHALLECILYRYTDVHAGTDVHACTHDWSFYYDYERKTIS